MANFHNTAFDEATLLKLDIYRQYIKVWLPTFINSTSNQVWDGEIKIFDFFSGPGKDSNDQDGSPIVAIDQCRQFLESLESKNKIIRLYFSEAKKSKIAELDRLLSGLDISDRIQYKTHIGDFQTEFNRQVSEMGSSANLIFIDQCGIKEVDTATFHHLIGLRRTDFIFFIASSFFARFRNSPEFKQYLDASKRFEGEVPYLDSHRIIADMYRSMIPSSAEYYLAPFSIRKGKNIYGLIFGSGHLAGIEKFLKICWDKDIDRGEANFDIDDDRLPKDGHSFDMFKDNEKPKKIEVFELELKARLLNGSLKADSDVFRFSLENGFLPVRHAKPVLAELIKLGKLTCNGRLRLSRECLKSPREFTLC